MNKLYIVLIATTVLFSCTKTGNNKIYQGTVIGFDPCTGRYTNNSEKGYVIKIDSVSETGGVVTIDTATTYHLPGIFSFGPSLFSDYWDSYLFPPVYRDSFRFRFSFSYTPNDQKVAILCLANIYTGAFYAATKGRQIIIDKIY